MCKIRHKYTTDTLSDERMKVMKTTNLLKYALRKHFSERSRQVLEEEIDKLLDDWYQCDTQWPQDNVANERIAVLQGLKLALQDVVGEEVTVDTFKVRTVIETSYLPSDDITIIWRDLYVCDECIQRSLIGFHYGETDQQTTETFSFNPLTAHFLL